MKYHKLKLKNKSIYHPIKKVVVDTIIGLDCSSSFSKLISYISYIYDIYDTLISHASKVKLTILQGRFQ